MGWYSRHWGVDIGGVGGADTGWLIRNWPGLNRIGVAVLISMICWYYVLQCSYFLRNGTISAIVSNFNSLMCVQSLFICACMSLCLHTTRYLLHGMKLFHHVHSMFMYTAIVRVRDDYPRPHVYIRMYICLQLKNFYVINSSFVFEIVTTLIIMNSFVMNALYSWFDT